MYECTYVCSSTVPDTNNDPYLSKTSKITVCVISWEKMIKNFIITRSYPAHYIFQHRNNDAMIEVD